MSKYEITPLNSNKTILQVVKGIEKYLHDNQIYKIFGYNGNYDAETELYDISDLYTSEELKADDVVLFDNCYLGIVDAVGTINFSVKDVINFRGEKGDTGATGQTGEEGVGVSSITSSQVDNQITLTFTLTDGTSQSITFIVSGGGSGTLIWSGNVSASNTSIETLSTDIELKQDKKYIIKCKTNLSNSVDRFIETYCSNGTTRKTYCMLLDTTSYWIPFSIEYITSNANTILRVYNNYINGSNITSSSIRVVITEIWEVS